MEPSFSLDFIHLGMSKAISCPTFILKATIHLRPFLSFNVLTLIRYRYVLVRLFLETCKHLEIFALTEAMKNIHEIVLFSARFSNGTIIPNAEIRVAGHKHVIKSTKFGDYFRLLLPGIYKVTCIADGKSLTVEVTVDKDPVVLDFVVSGDTIAGQFVHRKPKTENLSAKEEQVESPEQRSMEESITEDDSMTGLRTKANSKKGLSDNAIAAIVIITIGFIVCVVAGVVLFRRLKELREVEKGYSRIDGEGDSVSMK